MSERLWRLAVLVGTWIYTAYFAFAEAPSGDDLPHLGAHAKSVKPNSMAHNFMGIDIHGNWAHWFSSAQSARSPQLTVPLLGKDLRGQRTTMWIGPVLLSRWRRGHWPPMRSLSLAQRPIRNQQSVPPLPLSRALSTSALARRISRGFADPVVGREVFKLDFSLPVSTKGHVGPRTFQCQSTLRISIVQLGVRADTRPQPVRRWRLWIRGSSDRHSLILHGR
jgi:hypothetical protein